MERVDRIYSSYSGIYDLVFDAILQPGRRCAVAAMAIKPGDEILEVGVGTGLSLPLYPEGCRVVGIDISSGMLARAERRLARLGRHDVTLRAMSAHHIRYPEATFDCVLLSYVISTVEDPDRVVREVHRVCRPRGKVIFLNHFASRRRLVAAGERRLTPLTRRLGFRLDLPIETITRSGLFRVERHERVNALGLWSLVVCLPQPVRS
jgi:phosphatidylethanolamine/phosphatidyl-N-methylethanolamine N-methyltransferase